MFSLTYVASALEPQSWPRLLAPNGTPLPEIALAGRSNVGKSTFLNLLAGQKALAKVSSTPGKTQRMQFFLGGQRCVLVDLPGYGYAKAPRAMQADWSQAIQNYLETRPSLRLLVLLLDIRRDPSPEDLQLMDWVEKRGALRLLPVFTKTDILSPTECALRKQALGHLFETYLTVPAPRRIVWNQLLRVLDATHG